MDHDAAGLRRPRVQAGHSSERFRVNANRDANSLPPPSGLRDQLDSTAGSTRLVNNPTFDRPPPIPSQIQYLPSLSASGIGPPPPRPPRPQLIPPIVDPAIRNRPQQRVVQPKYWEGNGQQSLDPNAAPNSPYRPSSSTYTDSNRSSTGSIPEFPVPAVPPLPNMSSLPPRRAANLGPPPSARKGGPAMYSASSFVPPIPEEASETHSSYASSHVMPTSWGDGPPEYYMGEGIDEEDESEGGNSGRQSRAGDHDESTQLVRKVSLGKVGKPKLRSIKSGEGLDQEDRESQELNEVPPLPTELNSGAWRSGAVGSEAPKASTESSTFYNPPTPGDALPTPSLMAPSSTPSSGNASPVAPLDPRINQILGSLEKGGAIGTGSTTSPHAPSPEPSEQIKGAKRPPRLNLAVTKDPEVRGSSSSLPELIRRATKLASNLDRGKTASRVGLLNILEAKEKERSPKASREGSISDILAAFPSPSLATPTGERPGSRWPSPLPKSGLAKDQSALDSPTFDENHQRRRCCGMPFWAFILLCIILILLVAAAVIIPVTLVVLPRQSHNVPDEGWEACKKSNPCAHGGTSVFINKQCRCVCSGGFLGAACEIVADSECTNTEITTPDQPTMTFKDATVASNIPRLFQGAQSNFSLPLSSQSLLSLFAFQNLSCASEDALVTFDGKASRRRSLPLLSQQILPAEAEIPLSDAPIPFPTSSYLSYSLSTAAAQPTNHERMHLAARAVSQSSIADTIRSTKISGPTGDSLTSNGIVFAAPSGAAVPAASSAATAPSSLPSASKSSASPGDSSSSGNLTPQILDFARVATLFVFQETSSLDTAVSAQEKLQAALTSESKGSGAKDFTHAEIGNGIIVDLEKFTVDLGNGTVFGRGPGRA